MYIDSSKSIIENVLELIKESADDEVTNSFKNLTLKETGVDSRDPGDTPNDIDNNEYDMEGSFNGIDANNNYTYHYEFSYRRINIAAQVDILNPELEQTGVAIATVNDIKQFSKMEVATALINRLPEFLYSPNQKIFNKNNSEFDLTTEEASGNLANIINKYLKETVDENGYKTYTFGYGLTLVPTGITDGSETNEAWPCILFNDWFNQYSNPLSINISIQVQDAEGNIYKEELPPDAPSPDTMNVYPEAFEYHLPNKPITVTASAFEYTPNSNSVND